ncbi:putative permease YjgP/YjgQ family protein [Rubripirellula lacrimiformis]|uniref:Putative permease YjgP/YjgQ family protein n=1 Tax=Rubripirellula lacrimiformis TaxID=1930273 RepID=A0A517NFK3_9BACT|nr:LptF/LptG family permease [Rubripirellula lacrimiformis]QDT05914.1 putative permease YjgP/YjgQ family protein [Rubripirellula lacrimiformis]
MGKLQRKVVLDVLGMFVVSLFALTTLVLVIGVARESLDQGLNLASVLRLLPFAAPNALALSIPGTTLFSTCCIYGRMSADNELTAMQSVGISTFAVMWPTIILTVGLSIATVILINTAFTWGFHGVQNVVVSSVENIAYGVLRRERNFQHGNFSLTVRDVVDDRLIEPLISVRRDGQDPIVISAREATMSYIDKEQVLSFAIYNGTATVGGNVAFHFPGQYIQRIPLGAQQNDSILTANPSHMRMRDLPSATVGQFGDIHRRSGEIAVHTGFSLLSSHSDQIAGADAMKRKAQLQQSRKRLHRLDAEMHRRWASGFTCLAFAIIGVPLSIRLRTSDTMTTFGVCFLPTLLIYYPVFALSLDMAKSGDIPACGVWIANGVTIAIGFVMMKRAVYRVI